MRGSTSLPRPSRVITTPAFAALPVIRNRKTRSGPVSVVVTPTPRGRFPIRIANAAIKTLGEIGDDWAIDILLEALRRGHGPRSRVASELEELAPAPGQRLVSLLRDWNPAVRFWGATLLRPYPDLGESTLIELT